MKAVSIGFTGTRGGMTTDQAIKVAEILRDARRTRGGGTAHHGDCVGADKDFDILARRHGFRLHIHPPDNDHHQAWCFQDGDACELPKPYLDRNKDIVESADFMIAVPCGFDEVVRSGTWHAVRHTRKLGKPLIIVWPDGTHKEEVPE